MTHINNRLKLRRVDRQPEPAKQDSCGGNNHPQGVSPNFCPRCGRRLRRPAETQQREQLLLVRLLDDHERFRAALAHDINEGFAQQLVGALIHLQGYARQRKAGLDDSEEDLQAGLQLLQDSIRQTQRMVNRLRPETLKEFGLVSAVNSLICELTKPGGPEIEFVVFGTFDDVAPRLENAAYGIIQELLKNACRHSKSENIRLKVSREPTCLQIEVQDWGAGFDPAMVSENCSGLQKICRHAELLGGRASINAKPGHGTTASVRLPLSAATAHTCQAAMAHYKGRAV